MFKISAEDCAPTQERLLLQEGKIPNLFGFVRSAIRCLQCDAFNRYRILPGCGYASGAIGAASSPTR